MHVGALKSLRVAKTNESGATTMALEGSTSLGFISGMSDAFVSDNRFPLSNNLSLWISAS